MNNLKKYHLKNLIKKTENGASNFPISIYVITSHRDNEMVQEYLERNNFFYYNNLNACFQNDLAIIDSSGKMALKNKTSVLKCPNGSGGVFKTILKYDLGKNLLLDVLNY